MPPRRDRRLSAGHTQSTSASATRSVPRRRSQPPNDLCVTRLYLGHEHTASSTRPNHGRGYSPVIVLATDRFHRESGISGGDLVGGPFLSIRRVLRVTGLFKAASGSTWRKVAASIIPSWPYCAAARGFYPYRRHHSLNLKTLDSLPIRSFR